MNQLEPLKNLLTKALQENDAEAIRQALTGRNLPLMGEDYHPAEIMYEAISLPEFDPELLEKLPLLLADLVQEEAFNMQEMLSKMNQMTGSGSVVSPSNPAGGNPNTWLKNEPYVFNLFLISSFIPRNQALFDALKFFYHGNLKLEAFLSVNFRAPRQLKQATLFQQTDSSFEADWLAYFAAPSEKKFIIDAEEEEVLLEALRGILWIPPTLEERKKGIDVSMARIGAALKAFHSRIEKTNSEFELFEYALSMVKESFPRPETFWAESFSPVIADFSEDIQRAFFKMFPLLEDEVGYAEEEDEYEELLPAFTEEMEKVWDALPDNFQNEIKALSAEGNARVWNRLWHKIMAFPTPPTINEALWSDGLDEIKEAFESENLELAEGGKEEKERSYLQQARKKTSPKGETLEASGSPPKRKKGSKGLGIDRLDLLAKVSKQIRQIDELLAREDETKARRYLRELIDEQHKLESEPEHVAKTLCNVAASAKERKFYAFVEEIYEEAQNLHASDPVIETGLAEVLKAQERFPEAEELYRVTVTKHPNDVVAQTGLAEVLKA